MTLHLWKKKHICNNEFPRLSSPTRSTCHENLRENLFVLLPGGIPDLFSFREGSLLREDAAAGFHGYMLEAVPARKSTLETVH